MERTCFAEVQNWLCSYWWVFQWVKWLMKALTPSPCLSFETWKLQLCWTFVKEGLTSVPCCCVLKTCIFQVWSARNGLFQSTEWLEGFGYSWACSGCPILPLPTANCPLLKPLHSCYSCGSLRGSVIHNLGAKENVLIFPPAERRGSLPKFTLHLISSSDTVVDLWVPIWCAV